MIADQLCPTSWRAKPGGFVGLMTLYESNYLRMSWLVADPRAVRSPASSSVGDGCDLYLIPLEHSRYTSLLRLTYEFREDGGTTHEPDLEVCVYHDARLAEVRSLRGVERHPAMRRWQERLARELDRRWARNMMLNKWLEYCAECGHRF